MTIEKQINDLRVLFNNKRIIDVTSKAVLSGDELTAIKRIIRNKLFDGKYEVSDDIFVELENGCCYIKDYDNV